MRAIIVALSAACKRINCPGFLKEGDKAHFYIHSAYYELEKALKILALKNSQQVKKLQKANILFFDANLCVTDGIEPEDIPSMSQFEIVIIDTTSATTKEHYRYLKDFRKEKKPQVLFFVSSGLKNEQMGADKNHYGTVRVFVKDNKKILASLIEFIKEKEPPVKSGISHSYRRMMKMMGAVPRNAKIIAHNLQDDDEAEKDDEKSEKNLSGSQNNPSGKAKEDEEADTNDKEGEETDQHTNSIIII